MTPQKDTAIAEARNSGGNERATIEQQNSAVRNREIIKKGKGAFESSCDEDNTGNQKDIKIDLGVSKNGEVLNLGENEG